MPGDELPVSTVPSLSVMLERSVSMTSRTAVMTPSGSSSAPSSSVTPFCSARRSIVRLGVASVTKVPAAEVSAPSDPDTLTTNTSTRSTRSKGKGASVRSTRVGSLGRGILPAAVAAAGEGRQQSD